MRAKFVDDCKLDESEIVKSTNNETNSVCDSELSKAGSTSTEWYTALCAVITILTIGGILIWVTATQKTAFQDKKDQKEDVVSKVIVILTCSLMLLFGCVLVGIAYFNEVQDVSVMVQQCHHEDDNENDDILYMSCKEYKDNPEEVAIQSREDIAFEKSLSGNHLKLEKLKYVDDESSTASSVAKKTL